MAYAQRVVNSERERFEKEHGWVIKTMERKSSLVRDEYAPVIFAQQTVSYLESIDMMSGEVDYNTAEHCSIYILLNFHLNFCLCMFRRIEKTF